MQRYKQECSSLANQSSLLVFDLGLFRTCEKALIVKYMNFHVLCCVMELGRYKRFLKCSKNNVLNACFL